MRYSTHAVGLNPSVFAVLPLLFGPSIELALGDGPTPARLRHSWHSAKHIACLGCDGPRTSSAEMDECRALRAIHQAASLLGDNGKTGLPTELLGAARLVGIGLPEAHSMDGSEPLCTP